MLNSLSLLAPDDADTLLLLSEMYCTKQSQPPTRDLSTSAALTQSGDSVPIGLITSASGTEKALFSAAGPQKSACQKFKWTLFWSSTIHPSLVNSWQLRLPIDYQV